MDSEGILEDYPGERLRALRRAQGVSQRHLAEESGVGQSVICDLERGADARWTTWKRLFAALGFYAVLMPLSSDDAEDLLRHGVEQRKERMEDGRMSRWG